MNYTLNLGEDFNKKAFFKYIGAKSKFLENYKVREAAENGSYVLCSEKKKLEQIADYPFEEIEAELDRYERKVLLTGNGLIKKMERFRISPMAADTILEPLPSRQKRKNCEFRHENGNCLPVGGFCTAVSNKYCKKLHTTVADAE